MRIKIWLMILISFLFSAQGYAFVQIRPLTADKAFEISIVANASTKLTMQLKTAPGYYLYRDKFNFSFDPKVTADIHYPQGETKQDLNHGQYQIYTGEINIPLVLQTHAQKVKVTIDYQGCSDRGFCYPPMHKTVTVDLPWNTNVAATMTSTSSPSMQSLLTDQNGVRAILASQNMFILLMIFAGLGILLAFTPCILPMIPILTGIIVGHKQAVSTKKAFFLSLTYVLGASITYALAGMLAAYMGSSLQATLQQPWIIAIVSGMFVILSLSLFGVYDLHLPRKWQNSITSLSRKQEGGTYLGVFIMGMVSTLVVSPCVTAPLVGVLMYIAETGNMALGAGSLFFMGLGMGIPLIMIGMTAGKWLPRRGPWMLGVQYIFGVIMLAMAAWLLSRVVSIHTLMIFFAVLLFAAALFFGLYRAKRTIGLVTAVLAISLMTVMKMPSMMEHLNLAHEKQSSNLFVVVHNMDELNKQLSLAQAKGMPVMLDFYADWCESCKSMDKKVFAQPEVVNNMNKFVLLRADLTSNTAENEALLKKFDVIAPPTVLFFNNFGHEVNSHRIVGELDAVEFLSRIDTFITASCDKNMSC